MVLPGATCLVSRLVLTTYRGGVGVEDEATTARPARLPLPGTLAVRLSELAAHGPAQDGVRTRGSNWMRAAESGVTALGVDNVVQLAIDAGQACPRAGVGIGDAEWRSAAAGRCVVVDGVAGLLERVWKRG